MEHESDVLTWINLYRIDFHGLVIRVVRPRTESKVKNFSNDLLQVILGVNTRI